MDIRLNYQFVEITDSISGDLWAGFYDSVRLETLQPAVVHDNLSSMSAVKYEALPTKGEVTAGKFYSYGGKVVYCIQSHERTIYTPEQTPALFSFFRENNVDLEWIEGEKVDVGWERIFGGKTYKCLQAHQTLKGWEPDKTPSLWKEAPSEVIPVFKQPTGAHDAYRIGAKVHFPTINDPIYESLIDYNTYSPTVYPAGWRKL